MSRMSMSYSKVVGVASALVLVFSATGASAFDGRHDPEPQRAKAILAADVLPLPIPQIQPFGAAKNNVPYTAADLTYGHQLITIMDAERIASAPIAKRSEEPYKIVGDGNTAVYSVGIGNLGSYLITTPRGNVLIDVAYEDTAPQVERNILRLGFKLKDIKYLLVTEAHSDHAGGLAYFKAKTGAQVWVMEGDDALLLNSNYPKVVPDKVLKDLDTLNIGGVTFIANHIPGHTPGSTTWTWKIKEAGQTLNVAQVCCWGFPKNVVSDPNYSTATLRAGQERLRSLSVDVPLSIHTYHFDNRSKLAALKTAVDGGGPLAATTNPFVEQLTYRGVLAHFEEFLELEVCKQGGTGRLCP